MTTVLVSPRDLAAERIEVRGEAYRHLFRSRRLAVGDTVRVVDGAGRARSGRVVAVSRQLGELALGENVPSLEPPRRLEILVAPPEPARADWLVEKATELGASAIRFLLTERSARDFAPSRLERLDRVARAAVEQCGRARVPEITGPHPWASLPDLVAPLPCRRMLDPGARQLDEEGGADAIAVLVGPEGGWSAAERSCLQALDCSPLRLGERILRIETAAIAAAARLLFP